MANSKLFPATLFGSPPCPYRAIIGAQSLLLPFVQNAQEAEAAVRAMRHAPEGIRGMGGSMRASNFGRTRDDVKSAQEELCLLVQVETAVALDNLEAIAAVDGVDGVFVGPADLSVSLGHPGEPGRPEVRSAIDRAIGRIRDCGKAPGILMIDEARARDRLGLGALFVALAMDLQILVRGADALASRFAERPARGLYGSVPCVAGLSTRLRPRMAITEE